MKSISHFEHATFCLLFVERHYANNSLTEAKGGLDQSEDSDDLAVLRDVI